ncbi:outer membrane lipoprotein-sorting protein [Shewanella sp. OPT22]|nr:outer membrane lipoprotein-sorting protein [Shewanella sp. OPT22]
MNIQTIIFSLFTLLPTHQIHAETLSAQHIMDNANLSYYYVGDDGRAEARMKIIDKQGRTQLRQFTILRKDVADGGDQDMLVHLSRPSDVKNTVFRVVRHPQAQDDRWLYLPGLDLIKRISSGDKRTSFVGSDFFYEDISGRSPTLDSHQLIEKMENKYHLKSIPKHPDNVEFNHYESWIDSTTFLPIKVTYFDQNNSPMRELTALKTKVIQGHPVITSAQVKNYYSGNKTIMQIRGVKFDLGLPSNIFSEKSLRTPPFKWLRKK